jgi:putative Mn2+ efflux pump MntP
LSFALLGTSVWLPALLIGWTAFGLSILGLMAGNRLGKMVGKRFEIFGGLVRIAIGLRIVFEHLA